MHQSGAARREEFKVVVFLFHVAMTNRFQDMNENVAFARVKKNTISNISKMVHRTKKYVHHFCAARRE